MTIKLLSPNNTFEQWTYTTRSLIGVYNSLTDGNINTYIVSANTRSIETYDWANTVNVKIQSYSNFTNTVNTFIWNTKANTDAAFEKTNVTSSFANTVNVRVQSLYDSGNSTIIYSNSVNTFVNAAFTYSNISFFTIQNQVQYVGSAASTTGTINLPTNIQANDLIILSQSSDTVLAPLLTNWIDVTSNTLNTLNTRIQYKKANVTPETQITGLTANMPAVAVVFRNVYEVFLANTSTSTNGNSSVAVKSTDVTLNSISVLIGTRDDDAVANTTTAPSGYNLANVSDTLNATHVSTVMVAYNAYPISTGTYTFGSEDADAVYAASIVLKPTPSITQQTFDSANSVSNNYPVAYSYGNTINTLVTSQYTHANAAFNFANTVNVRNESSYSYLNNTVNVAFTSQSDNSNTLASIANSDVTNVNLNNSGIFDINEFQTLRINTTSNGRISNVQVQSATSNISVNLKSETINLSDYLIISDSETKNIVFRELISVSPAVVGNTPTSTTSAMSLPSSIQVNDVVFVASVSDDLSPTTPTGFTTILSNSFGNLGYYTISYKVITGSETQISGLDASGAAHMAVAIRNCNTQALVVSSSSSSNTTSISNGTHNTPNVPDITTIKENSGLLVFGFIDNNPADFVSAPTGFTLLGNNKYGVTTVGAALGAAFKTAGSPGLQTIDAFTITISGASGGAGGSSTTGALSLEITGNISGVFSQNVSNTKATSNVKFDANTNTLNLINLSITNSLTENVTTQNTVSSNVIQINPSVYGKYQNILITSNTTFTDNLANGQTSVLAIRKPYGNTLTWPSNIQWIQNDSNNPPNNYGTKQSDKYGFDLIELRKANSSIIFANRIGTFANNSARLVGVTNSTTNTITLPSGLQANDVVVIASQSDQVTQTTPTGYTSGQLGNNASDLFYQWSYKVMGETPDTTASGIADGTLSIAFALRGVAEAIFDNTPPAVAGGSFGMPNPPLATLTTSDPILNIIIGFLDDDNITMTAPTNYTLIRTNNYTSGSNTGTIGAAYRLITQSGSEDPGPFGGGGTDVWVAATIPFISIGY